MRRRVSAPLRAIFGALLNSGRVAGATVLRAARRLIPLALLALLLVSPMASVMAASSTSSAAPDTLPIKHIFIFVQENHTFDNYFGYYPGVNGLAEATPQ